MKLFTFSLLIIAIVFTIGCYTENPICSDNYCVSGEIFLRSELKEGEVFSEINVVESSLIAAIANTTVATPVETTPLTPDPPAETGVTLMDIINDAGTGSETYLNQTVTVTATVANKSDDGTAITLYKNANVLEAAKEKAFFVIISLDDPIPLVGYTVGNTYAFTVFIKVILPPNENRAFYAIGASLAE